MLSVKGALALYGLCFAALLTVGGVLARYGLLGVVAAEWLCIGLPVIATYAAGPAPMLDALRLRAPRPWSWVGATLCGASAWVVIAFGVAPLQEHIVPTPPELIESLERTVASGEALWVTLLGVAVTPAICEELLLRGALLPAIRQRTGPRFAVVAAALLFALLHLSPYRFVPTFLLGLSFGAVAAACGSTLPAVLAHAINNAVVVLLTTAAGTPLREAIERQRPVAVGAAVAVLTIGLVLVHFRGRR